MGANARANLRHITGGTGEGGGFEKLTLGGEREPLRNAVGKRTGLGAEGIGALDAAAGLFADRRLVELGIDFVEITDALGGGAFGGRGAGDERPSVF